MRPAIVTYLYPNAIDFVPAFVESLLSQTLQDYRLIIFNDCVLDADSYFGKIKREKTIVPIDGTPLEIRFKSLRYLNTLPEEIVVFQDIDDSMSENRLEVASSILEQYDVVVNDLTITNQSGEIQSNKIWQGRLQSGFDFDYSFIGNKNIVGFGNTSIRRRALETSIDTSNLPLAPDWFIFYQLLEKGKLNCRFTSDAVTFYRHHQENIGGIYELGIERLKYVLNVKQAHYAALVEIGYDFSLNLQKTTDFINKISCDNFAPQKHPMNLFWWEENYTNI